MQLSAEKEWRARNKTASRVRTAYLYCMRKYYRSVVEATATGGRIDDQDMQRGD
jgi:hypothetical protein